METDWILVEVQKDGRISIPKSVREYHKINPGDKVSVKLKKEEE